MATRNYRPVSKYEPRHTPESTPKTILNWLNLKSVLTFGVIMSITVGTLLYIEIKEQTCVFEYTNIPDDFKKKGFTEQFVVNTINKMQHHIINYDPPIRTAIADVEQKKTTDNTINQTLSSREMSSIENMNIQGIPLLSLVHLTDRVLKFLHVPVNENYASLEFTTVGNQLQLAVLFKGIRREYATSCEDLTLMNSFYLLCYDASIFVLEETKPIALAHYYYDINKPEECINECLKVITAGKKNNAVISRAYTLWGLSLLDYTSAVSDKFRIAMQLDPDNHEARWISLTMSKNPSETYEDAIRKLIKNDSSVFAYWDQLLTMQASKVGNMDSTYLELRSLCITMERNLKNVSCPSQLYWDLGRTFQEWGRENKKWYDTAIIYYESAVYYESHSASPDLKKLSQYYNSMAYTHEVKALINTGLDPYKCINISNPALPAILEVSHAVAHH